MNLRRVAVLLGKELISGPRNFIFILAILAPILLTLVFSLLFGTWFSDKAKLGIADEGHSELPLLAAEIDSLIVRDYETNSELRDAVSAGEVDVGVVLPSDFDNRIAARESTELKAYIWGESLLKYRAVLGTTLVALIRDIAGQEPPVEIITTTLGDAQTLPWEDRLLPFIVMLSLLIGGLMVPATSMVQEKQNRTLRALTVTPTTLADLLAAKGSLAILVSVFMGSVTLALNRAWGGEPLLLLVALVLGAMMAAGIGLLLGVLVKDINTLFATMKSMGIVLYAPALVYMFPEIPQWIGKIFPTYYLIQPVIEIIQKGASWKDVLPEFIILVVLIVVLFILVAFVGRRITRVAG
jgi:ABC-2 type transport system permease protein